ncbi:hypothetical protein PGT21_032083 [Puccinia graminis f. sp. tritici]|uniref:Uncharacterized protein n=1 Tax=Puccinia graminis f. sp. tritici TaxID=56615 RepID=A0A5B0NFF5_PUCGR|nr:hypothetical protein PGT21_032083 [Puccinia graminis f. sp. tritici]
MTLVTSSVGRLAYTASDRMSHTVCCDTRSKGGPLPRVSQQTACDIPVTAVLHHGQLHVAPARSDIWGFHWGFRAQSLRLLPQSRTRIRQGDGYIRGDTQMTVVLVGRAWY